ncbi:uncharacterized protein METZ01_LOCUS298420, partial [marine metagenome]
SGGAGGSAAGSVCAQDAEGSHARVEPPQL